MTLSNRNRLKILYVGMRYDYGLVQHGTSFEFNNIYQTLLHMDYDVTEFDFMTLLQNYGKEAMNSKLLEKAHLLKPDLVFFVLFTDEILKETIRDISKKYLTFNWFCDDHWRFKSYSRYYAPCFTFVSTTDRASINKYHAHGIRNVLLTQWACNHYDYKRIEGAVKTFDVSFIGQPHGIRKKIISRLNEHGIYVDTFGKGWRYGRVTQQQMIHIINGSKINLNLSNSSFNLHTMFRNKQQIKGRNFEIPGCGSFLISNFIEELEEYFDIQKEIICFQDEKDLKDKIKFYSTHSELREKIASAGYRRTLSEHTYEKRFNHIFKQIGLTS